MSTIVCDASPLIFLAKLDRLNLIPSILGREIVVVRCVVDEVLGTVGNRLSERQRLQSFLADVRVVDWSEPTQRAGRLSACDTLTLSYAVLNKVERLVADERLLRRIAKEEGIATIGTLGLLAAAARSGLLTRQQAMDDVNAAISSHHLRVSTALYREVRRELLGGDGD